MTAFRDVWWGGGSLFQPSVFQRGSPGLGTEIMAQVAWGSEIELVADLLYCHIILLELCLDIVYEKVVEPFVSVSSAGLEHAGREVLRGYAKHLRIVFEDARLLVIRPAKFDEAVGYEVLPVVHLLLGLPDVQTQCRVHQYLDVAGGNLIGKKNIAVRCGRGPFHNETAETGEVFVHIEEARAIDQTVEMIENVTEEYLIHTLFSNDTYYILEIRRAVLYVKTEASAYEHSGIRDY